MSALSKVGRFVEYKERRILPVSLEAEIIRSLKQVAARENRPMNRIIQDLILAYLKAHGEDNTQFKLVHWQEGVLDFKALPTLGEDPQRWLTGTDVKEAEELRRIAGNWMRAAEQRLSQARPPPEETDWMNRSDEELKRLVHGFTVTRNPFAITLLRQRGFTVHRGPDRRWMVEGGA